ncbi:CDP-alcohol phosphatidyltransferase family protein [Actinoplanes sp. NPDC049681]|uniref:CDP-alcohol phosphatidyltransferase family protein n=1 Tax=Actinoplanes sp. NPDC049681 TaxID=3363905 RepID=UPI00378A7659
MTARSGRGPLVGVAVQVVLMAVLAATSGLSLAGWLAGTTYAVVLCMLLRTGLRRAGMTALGPANTVTLARATLVGAVTALVVTSFQRPVTLPVLVGLVAVALALDAVDGQVARRTNSTTALGARFDMEVDSILALVLSVFVAETFGWWAVALGAFRYAFVAATWAAPWLDSALPPRFSRKVVAAVQGVVLVVATARLLPDAVLLVAVAAVAISLVWSFGLDITWLWRAERARRAAVTTAAVADSTPAVCVRQARRILRRPASASA